MGTGGTGGGGYWVWSGRARGGLVSLARPDPLPYPEGEKGGLVTIGSIP